jgi:hypothetical protein
MRKQVNYAMFGGWGLSGNPPPPPHSRTAAIEEFTDLMRQMHLAWGRYIHWFSKKSYNRYWELRARHKQLIEYLRD